MKKIIRYVIYTAFSVLTIMAPIQNLHAQAKPAKNTSDTTKKNILSVTDRYSARYFILYNYNQKESGGITGHTDGNSFYTNDERNSLFFSLGGKDFQNRYFIIRNGGGADYARPTLYGPKTEGAAFASKGVLAFYTNDHFIHSGAVSDLFIDKSGAVIVGSENVVSGYKFKVSGKTLLEGDLSLHGNLRTGNTIIGDQNQSSTFTVNGSSLLNGDLSVTNILTASGLSVIGGSSFNSSLSVEGLLTTNSFSTLGNASFNANLSVANSLTTKDLNVTGNVSFNALSVAGPLTATGDLTVGSTTKNSPLTVNGISTLYGDLNVGSATKNSNLTVNGNSTLNGKLITTGDVTFGIYNKSSDIYIHGKDSARIRIPYSNGNIYLSSPQLYIRDQANVIKVQFDNERGKVSIGNGGFTGIAPALIGKYNLFVTKGILSEDYMIGPKTTWADHVFKPDYRLSNLTEIETYIKKYKHLPNIPSAQQIGTEGYSLHDMNAKFLEKIEELTLHQIEQEKQNNRQQVEIDLLKAQIESYKQLAAEVKTLKAMLVNDK